MAEWITDAQFAKDIDEKSILVSNQRIAKFLNASNYDQFIIVASKGMGKTLLLRHKRKLIEKQDPSILLIPRNETSDYVSLPTSLAREIISLGSFGIFSVIAMITTDRGLNGYWMTCCIGAMRS